MRVTTIALIAAIGACARTEPAPGRGDGSGDELRVVSLGADALEAANEVAQRHGRWLPARVVADRVAVVEMSDEELEELAALMHERHDRCGGFMVHESLEEARAWRPAGRPADAPLEGAAPPVDYTLDQGPAVREVLPELDETRILATIQELAAMKNRYYQSESGAAASRWLAARWRGFSARPDVTVELFDHGYAQRSVILTIPGTTRADEVVVLGGHLDSIALGGRDARAPGADDDASGIATLTEVARVLLAGDLRPERTVQLIAYAAEEVGLRGSLGIVREYRRRGVNVVGALQLDMTNYQGSDRDIWIIEDHTSAAQNAFLVRLIEAYVGATWGVDRCGYACSDHASWNRAGVPASMPFESRSSQRNRRIHTAKDTLEASGENAAHAVKFARLAAAYAIELAKTASPDAYTAGTDGGTNGRGIAAAIGLLLALAAQQALLAGWAARRGGAG